MNNFKWHAIELMYYDVISSLNLQNFDRDQTPKCVNDISCIVKQFNLSQTFRTSVSHILFIRQPVTCKVHGTN